MYSIGNVVYGIDLGDFLDRLSENGTGQDEFITEILGESGLIHTWYTGSGDRVPCAFGIKIAMIDECGTNDVYRDIIDKFKKDESDIQYRDLFNSLKSFDDFDPETEAEDRKAFEELVDIVNETSPRLIIVWSTS